MRRSGRTLDEFELDYAPIIATGVDEASIQRAIDGARDRIAFYGSTEAYRPVLEVHGWGDLQTELNQLNKRRQPVEMAALISDEILHTIAVVGTPTEVIDAMKLRLGGIIKRTGFQVPSMADDEQTELIARLKS